MSTRLRERRQGERRQKRSGIRRNERRSGFDRRTGDARTAVGHSWRKAIAYLRTRPHMLLSLLVLVNFLNVLDLVFTINVLQLGGAEANPIMGRLFENGAAPAAVFKLAVVGTASLLIWHMRAYRRILEATVAGLLLIGTVFAYHIYGALFLT